MESHRVIDYECREDCFAKCSHVRSRFIYGDLSYISKPWLTVVVPTYRRVNQLEQALDSILSQWHVDFFWDIVVVDNEPDDGMENDTERLIRRIDNKRILYYRNSKNIRPGDNFNRGFLLSRGEWVMMLHDDDLLVSNALFIMGQLLCGYSSEKKPIGAIVASYIQIEYNPERDEIAADTKGMEHYLCSQPMDYKVNHLTHTNVKVFSHIGGTVPTNGSTYNRKAVIDMGGFNEDYGISGDLILLYNLENDYAVYQSKAVLGFWRWGINSMIKRDAAYKVIQDNFNFREYVYKKSWGNRIIGKLLRNCHYKRFATDVINERVNATHELIVLSDFDEIYSGRPNALWYLIYKCVICQTYKFFKDKKSKVVAKKVERKMKAVGV